LNRHWANVIEEGHAVNAGHKGSVNTGPSSIAGVTLGNNADGLSETFRVGTQKDAREIDGKEERSHARDRGNFGLKQRKCRPTRHVAAELCCERKRRITEKSLFDRIENNGGGDVENLLYLINTHSAVHGARVG